MAVLFATVLLLPLIGASCADTFVLPPAKKPVPAEGTQRRAIATDNGRSIEVFTARSAAAGAVATTQNAGEPRAFVLRFTGGDAPGSAAYTAMRWREQPVEIWAANYPGYGGSTGPRSLAALAQAALDSYDELRRVAGDRPIFVEGFSLGTVPALCVAANRPVAGCVLQNGPPLRQLILGRNGWWNLWLIAGPVAATVPREFDSIANAKASRAPALFIMAERDGTVPLSYQRQVSDTYAGQKQVVLQRGADHGDPLTPAQDAEVRAQIGWLTKRAGS
jgi:pimeloyl-ACP methyl ester carboxylesterase